MTRLVRGLAPAAACLALAGCVGGVEEEPIDRDVTVHGELRAMMHQGEVGPHVGLDSLLPAGDLYAVGALADLAGEVTIVAGTAYLSYPDGESARTEVATRSDAQATLLVAARVDRWTTRVTEQEIAFDELDAAIERLAAEAGLDTGKRIPFLLEGTFRDLRWHVIDGSRLPAGPSTHEAHAAAGVRMQRDEAPATLVGFWSASDQGVFTHRGSRTHVHGVVGDPPSAGHVDHVGIPAGTVVKLPAEL